MAKYFIYFVSFVAAVGGLLFGFDTAIIAGALGYFKEEFLLNSLQEGWVVSSALVGCIVGAAIAGYMGDLLGRKKFLIISAILFIVSAIGSAIPSSVTEFVIARFIGGIGVGAASMLSPLYIAEISPAAKRGRLVTLNQMAIVIGMLTAYFVGWSLAEIGDNNWRWMFGSEALPALFFLIFMFIVPESPRWLIKQERESEAVKILSTVSDLNNVLEEVQKIKDAIKLETGSLKQLLKPGIRITLIIGISLAVFQQITGINAVLYYSPRIFEAAGLDRNSALLQSVIVGVVNMGFTIVAILTVDKLGRKALLMIASGGMFISLILTGLAFQLGSFDEFWILLFILSYIAFFALAMGPVVWVVMSEIFPTKIRARAMSIATVCLWIACFVVSLTFPILTDVFSESLTFWTYSLMCIATFIFVWKLVPETKGKTLEEIEHYWLSK